MVAVPAEAAAAVAVLIVVVVVLVLVLVLVVAVVAAAVVVWPAAVLTRVNRSELVRAVLGAIVAVVAVVILAAVAMAAVVCVVAAIVVVVVVVRLGFRLSLVLVQMVSSFVCSLLLPLMNFWPPPQEVRLRAQVVDAVLFW